MKRSIGSGVLVCLIACGSLRENPLGEPDEPGTPDASTDLDASEPPPTVDGGSDGAVVVPPIREDVACAGADAWFQTGRAGECSQRTLRVVQETPAESIGAWPNIDAAWSLSGRLGIVLSWVDGLEAGYLQALTFDTATAEFTVRQDIARPNFDLMREGEGARIAARPDGTFEVLSMLAEQDAGGEVFLRSLPPLQGFTAPSLVFTGADRRASLGLYVHGDSSVTATATLPRDGDSSIVTRRRQPQATAFDEALPTDFDFFRPGPDSNGNHRMAADAFGGLHIVYEMGISGAFSQPRTAQLSSEGWINFRTVDPSLSQSPSGSSLSLFVLQDEKNAVYLAQATDADDNALPEAHLVRARWRSLNEPVVRVPIATGFVIDGNDGIPVGIHGTAASAADASGAMHVVFSREDPALPAHCQVFYAHEGAVNGVVQVLTDTVSDVVSCSGLSLPVALAVEPGGRPHIAYIDPLKGVVYATRYDR